MMEKLAGRIGAYLVRAGIVKEDDREVLSFGLFHLLADAEQVVILVGISLLLGVLPVMGALLLFYGGLRRYIGGAHAKTHGGCLAAYTVAATAGALLASVCPSGMACPLSVLLAVASLALVYTKAPVMHPNSPKSALTLARFKKRGRIVAAAELALVVIGTLFIPAWGATALLGGGVGGFMAACTLLLPIPGGKGGEVS